MVAEYAKSSLSSLSTGQRNIKTWPDNYTGLEQLLSTTFALKRTLITKKAMSLVNKLGRARLELNTVTSTHHKELLEWSTDSKQVFAEEAGRALA